MRRVATYKLFWQFDDFIGTNWSWPTSLKTEFNFVADVWKGGDFLKSYRAKWSCKQVAFFYVRGVKGAESSIFTLGLIRFSRILSYMNQIPANSKALTCKLHDNTSHIEGLITWARLASSAEVTFITVFHERGQHGAAIFFSLQHYMHVSCVEIRHIAATTKHLQNTFLDKYTQKYTRKFTKLRKICM